jgi:hypothetical protein
MQCCLPAVGGKGGEEGIPITFFFCFILKLGKQDQF